MPPKIALPDPRRRGNVSIEESLEKRRSVREFADRPLPLSDLGQLLWAAQGTTGAEGERAAPSAGALYPLELYAVTGDLEQIDAGVYHYASSTHELAAHGMGDVRAVLAEAACEQDWMATAPITIAIGAVQARTARKYGDRAARYVTFEAGHAAENIALQAVACGLGSTMVGAFEDDDVRRLLRAPRNTRILLLVPVGYPA